MKVGDYVRFDYHRVTVPIQIARITEVHYHITDEDDNVCYSTDVGLVISESNLVKESSSNIADLIEVGDYVNGNKIVHIQEEKFPDYPKRLLFAGVDENNIDDVWEVYNNEDIKSIVTHEQFERMQYKVGE